METKKVYEYVIVKGWFDNLEGGTRLYYDHDKQGYTYHYESERTNKNPKCEVKTLTTEDYFISINIADENIKRDLLTAGPEIGELEFNK